MTDHSPTILILTGVKKLRNDITERNIIYDREIKL